MQKGLWKRLNRARPSLGGNLSAKRCLGQQCRKGSGNDSTGLGHLWVAAYVSHRMALGRHDNNSGNGFGCHTENVLGDFPFAMWILSNNTAACNGFFQALDVVGSIGASR